MLLLADRSFAAAETAFQRAIALDPTLVTAHRRRAEALTAVGRFAEAERSARRAVALQPSLLQTRRELLEVLLFARRYRHAAAEGVATLSLAPDLGEAWYVRGWALVMAGDEAEWLDCLLKGLELRGVAPERASGAEGSLRGEGFRGGCGAAADLFADQPLHFMRRGLHIASLRALAGQTDEAFAILDAAAARGDPTLMFFPWMPHFDTLKSDAALRADGSRVRLDG